MTHPRIIAIVDAIDELRAFVESEPRLAPFDSATAQLSEVGRQARANQPITAKVECPVDARIPSRELAIRIHTIVSKAPGWEGDEDEETDRTMEVLHLHLTAAIVHALFVDYSDLMRSSE